MASSFSSSPTLPQDIIFLNILVRVPAKSILRFLCVSKSWLSNLTHPKFIRLHFSHRKYHMLFVTFRPSLDPPPCTLLRENPFELVDFRPPLHCYVYPRALVGSVSGWVCLTVDGGFYACNPFIRKDMFIPPTPARGQHRQYKSPFLFCMGFGFDPCTSDYNLIVIPLRVFPEDSPLLDRYIELERITYMYSLNKNLWKEVQSPVEDFVFEGDFGLSLGGSIFWLATNKGSVPRKKIVSFNIKDECFQEIMLPKYELDAPDDDFSYPATFSIQVVEETIHLSIIPRGRSHCHMWMLKESCGTRAVSWTKKGKVALPEAFWSKDRWVTGLTLDGSLWVYSFDDEKVRETDHYLLYDPKTKRLQNSHRSPHWFKCICLTESLIGLPHQEKRSEADRGDTFSFEDPKHMLGI